MAFIKISEQPSLYDDLEKKSVHELLTEINQEDHKVADAVDASSTWVPAPAADSVCSMQARYPPPSAWTQGGLLG